MVEVSIILLSFNEGEEIVKTIRKLKELEGDYEIIVTDNGNDNTEELIKKNFKDVVFVKNGRNLGSPGAFNRGLEKAKGKYVLMTQKDVFYEKGFLKEIIKEIQDENIGAGVGKFYYVNSNRLISAGYKRNKITSKVWSIGKNEEDKGQYDDVDLDYYGGGLMLIKKKVLDEYRLDERMFLGEHDADFCLRMKERYKIKRVDAKVYHKGDEKREIPAFRMFHSIRGRVILNRKHNKFLYLFVPLYFGNIVLKGFGALIKGKGRLFLSYYQGFFAGFGNKVISYDSEDKRTRKY